VQVVRLRDLLVNLHPEALSVSLNEKATGWPGSGLALPAVAPAAGQMTTTASETWLIVFGAALGVLLFVAVASLIFVRMFLV